jgi:Zn-dependent peptidase ImmA (M78 family)
MSSKRQPPGELFVQRHGTVDNIDDVLEYVHFLRSESGLGVDPPIDLARIFTSFQLPHPKYIALPNQQGLLANPETGLILVNADDIRTRQRFTEGHELLELLFSALPRGNGNVTRCGGLFTQAEKEQLCNVGAAELLMPKATFLPRILQKGISFQTGRELAAEYGVSISAALVQLTRVGPGRHAVVLWRPKNKPSEIRSQISSDQLALWEQAPARMPPKKLRVEWSLEGRDVPFIPKDKSIFEDSSIYAAWRDAVFTIGRDCVDLGKVSGELLCESQPFEVDDERWVLSLLHFPGDSCPEK